MYRATARILRELDDSPVKSSKGKTIAFRDVSDQIHVIVSEDAWPEKGKTIFPEITVSLPEIGRRSLQVNRPFSLTEHVRNRIRLRLRLEEHQQFEL